MNIKIKRLVEEAILPSFAHPGDAGMDLCSVEDKVLKPSESALVKTGLSIELPKNTEAQIRPRSGLAYKKAVTVLNTPGTIDEGYRGEIGIILINHGKEDFVVQKGMRIAQMVIKPILEVTVEEITELSGTTRGEGGFGSTGTH
ncbi:MAG: dUTP diphosphatase [Kiritimatiellae bacterium]|jgi:dUTP pyrophosphatase|nr:dUTP diphosphatase [Kiritimatiellia bacterium]